MQLNGWMLGFRSCSSISKELPKISYLKQTKAFVKIKKTCLNKLKFESISHRSRNLEMNRQTIDIFIIGKDGAVFFEREIRSNYILGQEGSEYVISS